MEIDIKDDIGEHNLDAVDNEKVDIIIINGNIIAIKWFFDHIEPTITPWIIVLRDAQHWRSVDNYVSAHKRNSQETWLRPDKK